MCAITIRKFHVKIKKKKKKNKVFNLKLQKRWPTYEMKNASFQSWQNIVA